LSTTEVYVIFASRNGFVGFGILSNINEQMVVTSVRPGIPGIRNAHVAQTEADRELPSQSLSITGMDNVQLGIRRRPGLRVRREDRRDHKRCMNNQGSHRLAPQFVRATLNP
jgi:hypothetical protein